MYKHFGKRALDFVIALTALAVLSPVLLVVGIGGALKFGLHGFLFSQIRPGKAGVPFTLYKFRSMTNARGASGELLPDAERLTGWGRALRASSLDELPQLLNVVRGDMSLIGPRPLLMEYLPRYSPEQGRRHEVRPGITGLAQVSGRNLLSWPERLALDVEYVDRLSLTLDLWIAAKTVLHVVTRTGIRSKSSATMEEFLGNDRR